MRPCTCKALVLFAAVAVACDDPVGLVGHDDAGGSEVDSGEVEPADAAAPDDAGSGADVGPGADVGQTGQDTGVPDDASEPADAGEPADAAQAPDAGGDVDAGDLPDAGDPPDAAEPGLDAAEPPDSGGGTGAVGQPCTDATDCETDTCLGAADDWPVDGYCSQSGCSQSDPIDTCPAGSRCRDISQTGYRPMCLDLCATDGSDPCAPGLDCARHGGPNPYYVCEPP